MKLIGSYPSTRLRRNRKMKWSRNLVSENNLSPSDLIWPIFLTDGKNQKNQISTMPEVYRYSVDQIEKIVEKALKLKLPLLALFPHSQKKNKDKIGSEALNENNLVCKALRIIKKKFKSDIGIMCDVALDPYTSHGHDGIIKSGIQTNKSDLTKDELNRIQTYVQRESYYFHRILMKRSGNRIYSEGDCNSSAADSFGVAVVAHTRPDSALCRSLRCIACR